jgi:hypothetical protein
MSGTKKKRRLQRIRIGIALGVLLLAMTVTAALLWASIAYFRVRPIVRAEYGDPLPDVTAFGARAEAYTELPEKLTIGLNRLRIRLRGGAERTVWLLERDTVSPNADAVEKTISTKVRLKPTDLIENLRDADKVWVEWEQEPPFGTVGTYPVTVLLEDVSGNRSRVESLLSIQVTGDGITIEAGDPAPGLDAFLLDDYSVTAVEGLDDGTLHTPGTHTVRFTIDGQVYESTLTVTDTHAPAAEPKTVFAAPGTQLEPMDFVASCVDGSAVEATFLNEPDPDSRDFQQIGIRLTDLAKNTTDLTAGLLLTDVQPITVEAANTALTAKDCYPEESDVVFLQTFVPNRVGTFSMPVLVNGETELAILEVVDTTPPKIVPRNAKRYRNHPVAAEELVAVSDLSETTLTMSEIDWTREGEQSVTITAVDTSGNRAETTFSLKLLPDTEPPKLYGVRDRNQYVGEPVAYLAEVFAIDALDGEVAVQVDASRVDPNNVGFYTVTYTATDSAGNTATQSCRFTFTRAAVSEEALKALAKEVVESVTTPEMTRTERLIALYDYVYAHVQYNGYSDKSDWRKEAVNGLQRGVGDCFTYYATLRALLDETDIPYMSVTRKGGATRHYWLLVNVGTGWYHLDANNNTVAHWRCFMWTNAQCAYPVGFWAFEESIYPAVATEPFDAAKVIELEKNGTLQ